MPHYIDGKAEAVRLSINFAKFAVTPEDLTSEEVDLLLTLPESDTGCRIRQAKNKSGSAFQQMWELGIVCGFMRGSEGNLRVLVVYTERPNADGSYDFGFVDTKQVARTSPAQLAAATQGVISND
jgi:hypothetical protein